MRKKFFAERKRIEKLFCGNDFIDTYIDVIPEMSGSTRLWCLGESIKMMKDADLVVGPADSYKYPGCEIEVQTARLYQIPVCIIQMYPNDSYPNDSCYPNGSEVE